MFSSVGCLLQLMSDAENADETVCKTDLIAYKLKCLKTTNTNALVALVVLLLLFIVWLHLN
jgi:hypothetical protein